MRDLITARLQGNSEAIMLATTCLSASQAFIIDLSRFISKTHRDLELSGFPAGVSWLLVTKLVVRIFGTDLDRVRSFMRGKMDTLDHTTGNRCFMGYAKDSLYNAGVSETRDRKSPHDFC